jgi:hypothetical protein
VFSPFTTIAADLAVSPGHVAGDGVKLCVPVHRGQTLVVLFRRAPS